MNEERIIKKLDNGNFYIIGFLVALILYFGLISLFSIVSLSVMEFRQPGFALAFERAITGNGVMTEEMWGVQIISQFIGEILLAGLLVIVLRKELVKNFIEFKKDFKYNILSIVLGFVVIICLGVAIGIIYELLGISGLSENENTIRDAIQSKSGIFMILAVIFLAPLVEELIFRKLMFGAIEEKFRLPRIVAVIISALIFASMHDINIFFFQYLSLALVISGSYSLYKNNIFIPMGIHFLNNTFSVIVTLFILV